MNKNIWWFLLGCWFLGVGCGTEPTTKPPPRVVVPKTECRLHGDCAYPRKCINELCVEVPALPTISLIVPEQGSGGAVILHVWGRHFVKGAVVRWDGTPLKTSYLSETSLVGTISSVKDQENHEVTVVLPDGTSSRAYLLALQPKAQIDRLSFSQLAAHCGKETLVVWGRFFWKGLQASIVSKDGKKDFPATEITFRPNGELHLTFNLSAITKGAYELVIHNGDPGQAVTKPIEVIDKLPDPQLLSWGPRQFWWGSQAQIFLTGLHLQGTDLRFQQQPVRLFQLNRSTYYLTVDLNELPRKANISYFWLTLRKLCQPTQSFHPIEVHDIPKPVVSGIRPGTITYSHVEDVVIEGEGFHPDARLWINDKEIPQARRLNLRQFVVPREQFAESGDYRVQVRNPQFYRSNEKAVQVNHNPVITQITPGRLPRNRSQKVTITGDNFGPQVQVKVDEALVEDVERVDATRLFVPGSAFPQNKSYKVVVINPGTTSLSSRAYEFTVTEGPYIETLSSPLILLGHSKGDIQLRGSDFDEKGSLLIDGEPADANYAQWINAEAWSLAVGAFEKEGKYTLQVRNADQKLSNSIVLFVRKAETKLLTEVREVGELTYLCGTGLRDDDQPGQPRVLLFQQGETQSLLEVGASNSTFDTTCLYFNTREIEHLEAQTYLMKVCLDVKDGIVCSNEFPWRWRGASQTGAPQTEPPRLDWVRPVKPTTWVWTADKQPETYSIMLGGQHFRGTTSVRIDGKDVSQIPGVRMSVLRDRIVLYDLPLPAPVYGEHVIELSTPYGRSNTYFFHIAQKPTIRIVWTPLLYIPRDDSFNFQFYGSGFSLAHQLFVDGSLVKLGNAALPWSQFASISPYFLSSFDWTESSKLKEGARSFQLKDKSGVASNKIIMPAGNDDQWGKEPLALQAVEDVYRYTNSAGLAPYVNQATTLRIAHTGFPVSSSNAKLRGTVWVDHKSQAYTTGKTTLFGYSQLDLKAIKFTGTPRVVPIYLKHVDGTVSNQSFLTVMPAKAYRLTKVYNASDFSAIIRPDKTVQLQIHGSHLSKEDTFYFLGRKIPVDLYYQDVDNQDEFVRISVNAGDLPDGHYPLWATNPNTHISNSLLVTVRREGIAGAPRLRFINPMVWSQTALARVDHKLRLVLSAVGLTSETQLVFQEKSYPLQRVGAELAYVDISVKDVTPGSYQLFLQNQKEKTQSVTFDIVVEP